MKLICPSCDAQLLFNRMNIDADEAACPQCGQRTSISALLADEPPIRQVVIVSDSFDINQPPPGVSYQRDGMGWRITATTRHGVGYFLIVFALVFSGIACGVIYGPQLAAGKFDLKESLFGIPFIVASLVLVAVGLLFILGRTVVETDEREPDVGRLFVGLGPFGWTRQVPWSEVTRIEETDSGGTVNDQPVMQITLYRSEGDVHFGALLKDPRRRYVLFALQQLVTLRDTQP